jgi:uncharacterized protein (UPF0147 family)
MIESKVEVRIQKWSTHWSVKIFDQGEYPRVRTASSISHLKTIKKEENLNSSRYRIVTQNRNFSA